ncbi:hypothetical protein BDN70DRAFT_886143 [Pholiota conissans]|uniref:Uncharacterized protein n=1 Tax=Pholiota conissans TaxID=109636 RepID=A0A9P5YNQ4_9AGAR|nr:hypothetical protein BDN70DRAFT_886143 [Pholiota conissans]
MQFLTIVFFAAQVVAALANPLEARGAAVHTATKVFHTIVKQSPFLVDKTTTIVWTVPP